MIDGTWRKPQACAGNGSCAEVRAVNAGPGREVLVRHSERPEALRFTEAEWAAFLAGVRSGEFDLPAIPEPGDSR